MFDFRYFLSTLKYAVVGFVIFFVATFSAVGQTSAGIVPHSTPSQVKAGAELNKGAEAYRGARYDEAIAHFQKAVKLAPDLSMAKSYLATALSQNIVPGLTTPENLKVAQQAIDLFQEVLATDPHDVNSMKQIAGVEFSIQRLNDAKEWQKRVLAEDPKDADAAYTVGVIDWQEAHKNMVQVLMAAGFNDDGEGNAKAPAGVMEVIKAQNGALVEEGLQYLNQAVENRPNYDDAMAYLTLMYRRKADLDWGNETARKDDVAKAEEWTRNAMDAHKANEEKKNAGPASTQQSPASQ
ncbi:MAG: tetratricopeptide repeat protein [Terracidiphilus sp.]